MTVRRRIPANLMILVAVVALSSLWAPTALSFNIDFSPFEPGTPSMTYGAASGQPGVWNTIPDLDGSYDLFDLAGNLTAVTLTLAGTFNAGTAGGGAGFSPDELLLYRDSFSSGLGTSFPPQTPWSISISGLTDGIYDIWVYGSSNNAISTGPFTINGASQSELLGGGTTVPGVDFLSFQTTVSGGSLNLLLTWIAFSSTCFSGKINVAVQPGKNISFSTINLGSSKDTL